MKVPAALFTLALAGAAVAQDGFGLPECANNCANKFLQNGIGNCGKDIKCICEDKSFLGEIACCLTDACNEADQKAAVAAAANICDAVGVKGLPTEVACATASAASTTASRTGSGTAPAPTGTGANAATQNPAAQSTTTSESTNFGPRPTAAAGLGAIGGIIAAVALL